MEKILCGCFVLRDFRQLELLFLEFGLGKLRNLRRNTGNLASEVYSN